MVFCVGVGAVFLALCLFNLPTSIVLSCRLGAMLGEISKACGTMLCLLISWFSQVW